MKKMCRMMAATAVALGIAAAAQAADPLRIDPDGGGVLFGVDTIQSVDWTTGNLLAQEAANLEGPSAAGAGDGTIFDAFFQAKLGTFKNMANVDYGFSFGPTLLGEWTVVIGFTEETLSLQTDATGTTAQIGLAPTQNVNFFQIYYDAAHDANDLTGTGFTNGTMILEGTVTAMSNSTFTVNADQPNPPGKLDQSANGDNWSNANNTYLSLVGAGTTDFVEITVAVSSLNAAFFPDKLSFLDLFLDFNSNEAMPYTKTDPSKLFTVDSTKGTYAPNLTYVGGGTFLNGSTGARLTGELDPDVLIETDASTSFRRDITTVPEPGTMLLLGSGLLGLAFTGRRVSKKKNS